MVKMTDKTVNRLLTALVLVFLCTLVYGAATATHDDWPDIANYTTIS